MPKSRNEFDTRLNEIVAEHVSELVSAITKAVRQNMADELRAYLAGSGPPAGRTARAATSRAPAAKKRRVVPCIAPSCGSPSKGPRFHYLCDKHKDAPKKEYEAWRKAKRTSATA